MSKSRLKLFQVADKKTQTDQKEEKVNQQKKYVVKDGDDLWHIAETAYGSGYNAYDIARANRLVNPSLIEVGQELALPSLTPNEPTKGEVVMQKTEQVTITGAQYTIQQGDYLWKIALEAYGDGYAWPKIAQANNLSDPNYIHAGNTLIIPR